MIFCAPITSAQWSQRPRPVAAGWSLQASPRIASDLAVLLPVFTPVLTVFAPVLAVFTPVLAAFHPWGLSLGL